MMFLPFGCDEGVFGAPIFAGANLPPLHSECKLLCHLACLIRGRRKLPTPQKSGRFHTAFPSVRSYNQLPSKMRIKGVQERSGLIRIDQEFFAGGTLAVNSQ